jgi:S1-C subfamily serine protease
MQDDLNEPRSETLSATSRQSPRLVQIRRDHIWRFWPALAGLVVALLGATLYALIFPAPLPLSQNEIDESISEAIASATPQLAFSIQVYQTILPSLVYIQARTENEDEEDGFGVGSGVVINESGDILTAYHVVFDASDIRVIFSDGSEASAEIIATEPENDIAVLHPLELPGLIVPAVLGNLNGVRIGDETYAIGNPLGLTGSLSAGVISGFDRSVPVNEHDQRLEGLIQFDAAVNPGNSGGPLLNRQGQVIGIVTALANPENDNSFSGIGFAVPINTAVSVAGAPPY